MNITFVGMSGAGKSHVGRKYARAQRMEFIDIDREMEKDYGKTLQSILGELGEAAFLEAQAKQILELENIDNAVISPGGSVVYTESAMQWLADHSTIVYLDVPFETIIDRIDAKSRGIVGLGDKTLQELFTERSALYKKWATVVVKATDKQLEAVTEALRQK